ncbi:MAG: glycosyltransferase family 87 protein [Gemmatimonadaceae bacterium]
MRRPIEALGWSAVVFLAAAGFVLVAPSLARGPVQQDFDAYYSAARMLNAQLSPYGAIPDSIMGKGSPPAPHREYVYPPLLAGVLRPVTALPYRAASLAWFFGNVALLLVLWRLMCRLSATARRYRWVTLAALATFPAVYISWFEGQVSLLIGALMLWCVAATTDGAPPDRRRSDLVAGAALGMAGAIKVYPVLLIPVYVWHRQWRVVGSALAVGMLATGFGAVIGGGVRTTEEWFRHVLPAVAERAWPGNQSVVAVVERLAPTPAIMVWTGASEREVRLRPALPDQAAARNVSRTAQFLIVLFSAWAVLRRGALASRPALAADLSLAVLVMSLVVPVVWDHYYIQLLIPAALLMDAAAADRIARRVLLAVALLILLQRYWRLMLWVDESGWLLAFGFLGVLALWAATLPRCAARSGDAPAT